MIGRRFGHHVLRILCKLSLEPTICVRKTQDSFGSRRESTLMIAKFVPGLATLAPPVAGQNGMSLWPLPALRRHRGDALGGTRCCLREGSSAMRSSAIPACSIGLGGFPARLLVLGIVGFFDWSI